MANERTRTEFKYGIRTKISLEYVENKKRFPPPRKASVQGRREQGRKADDENPGG